MIRGATAILLIFLSHMGCTQGDKSTTPPRDSSSLATGRVLVYPQSGPALSVNVEVAKTEADRARGLMFRTEMADDAGMLFLFNEDEVHSFWMKNTLIPLDLIFIRADLSVAGIVENATPETLSPRMIDEPSRHVLEVNGGWCNANGVGAGATVVFQDIDQSGIE